MCITMTMVGKLIEIVIVRLQKKVQKERWWKGLSRVAIVKVAH